MRAGPLPDAGRTHTLRGSGGRIGGSGSYPAARRRARQRCAGPGGAPGRRRPRCRWRADVSRAGSGRPVLRPRAPDGRPRVCAARAEAWPARAEHGPARRAGRHAFGARARRTFSCPHAPSAHGRAPRILFACGGAPTAPTAVLSAPAGGGEMPYRVSRLRSDAAVRRPRGTGPEVDPITSGAPHGTAPAGRGAGRARREHPWWARLGDGRDARGGAVPAPGVRGRGIPRRAPHKGARRTGAARFRADAASLRCGVSRGRVGRAEGEGAGNECRRTCS